MVRESANTQQLLKRLAELGVKDPLSSNTLGEVYLMLSLRCNLRCKVCSWWGLKGPCRDKRFIDKYASSLTLKELKPFIEDVISFSPKTVTFSGGEPLMYKKWYVLAGHFKARGVKVSLTTNGVFFLNNFDKLINAVDEINLSLGGPPSILNLIRDNHPSHFNKILRGLKKISDFKRNNFNKPSLGILYTISDVSYSHMSELIEFLQDNRISVDRYCFQHLMFINPETFKAQQRVFKDKFGIRSLDLWRGYTYVPKKINFKKFKDEIKKVKKMANVRFSPNLYLDEIEDYYKHNRGALHYANYCTAPWHQIDMMPNGDIYTCHDYFIGNIKNASFKDIWNGKKVKNLRKYLLKKMFPGCKGCFYHYSERKA